MLGESVVNLFFDQAFPDLNKETVFYSGKVLVQQTQRHLVTHTFQ